MKGILIIISLLIIRIGFTQDVVYTQMFGSPLYLNPAFAGSQAKTSFYLNARQQWQSVDGGYVTSSFAAAHRFDNINSGVGLIIKQDEEGSAKAINTNISGIYTYILHLNKTWTVAPAIQASFVSQRFKQNSFVFGDQINDDFSINETTNDKISLQNNSLIDLSAGAIVYNNDFWFGGSIHHITEPINYANQTNLNRKIGVHSGYQFTYKTLSMVDELILSPSININLQNPFIRVGMNFSATYLNFTLGSGLANVTTSFSNRNILNSFVLIGYSDEHFKVGYSYDFTVRGRNRLWRSS